MSVKIGLEIHCQLTSLKTKLFCSCSADYRGKDANTNVCPICLGLPGTLPLLNKKALEFVDATLDARDGVAELALLDLTDLTLSSALFYKMLAHDHTGVVDVF